jgi:hypothetical protein
MASVGAATGAAMDAINGGAATVWHNQQQLEAEARLLHQQTQRFAKQSGQWVASYQGFHHALKALGDVENWAKTIESDMSFIHSSLEGLQQQQQQQGSEAEGRQHAAAPGGGTADAAGGSGDLADTVRAPVPSNGRKLVERDPTLDGLPVHPNGPYLVYEDQIPALEAAAAARRAGARSADG